MEKYQGALEMLIMIGAILVVAVLVVYFMTNNAKQQTSDFELNKCKEAASQCKMLKNSSNGADPCIVCARNCVKQGTSTPLFTLPSGVTAAQCCAKGNVSGIFKGTTAC